MATLSQVLVFANTYLFPSLLMSPREIIFIVIHKLTMCTPHDSQNKTGYYDDNQTADIDTKNYYDTQWPLTVST